MTQLTFENFTLSVQDRVLLKPVNLSMTLKGVSVVRGDNGAGKSLFLLALHGMRGCGGRVLWDGVDARQNRQSRGFLAQNPPILRRSVRANLAFIRRVTGRGSEQEAERLLARFNLHEKGHLPASRLSGGADAPFRAG